MLEKLLGEEAKLQRENVGLQNNGNAAVKFERNEDELPNLEVNPKKSRSLISLYVKIILTACTCLLTAFFVLHY